MSPQRRAFLYCTYFQDLYLLGEIHDEGSLHDLIKAHCTQWGDKHADAIHILIEGSQEYEEVRAAVAAAHAEALDDSPSNEGEFAEFPETDVHSADAAYDAAYIREQVSL